MKRIYKYEVEALRESVVMMPKYAEILSTIEQNGKIIVYAIVDVDQEEVPYKFCVLGTGWDADIVSDSEDYDGSKELYVHLGTLKIGVYVWHVFYDLNSGN